MSLISLLGSGGGSPEEDPTQQQDPSQPQPQYPWEVDRSGSTLSDTGTDPGTSPTPSDSTPPPFAGDQGDVPSADFIKSQQVGGRGAISLFGEQPEDAATVGADPGSNDYGFARTSEQAAAAQGQDLSVGQQNEPWQTSLLNAGKNLGQGIQDKISGLFGNDPNSLRGKIGQGVSFFPSLITGAFGLPAKDSSPGATAAFNANYKTLEGDTPAPWDFAAEARALNAAREERAGELGQIAGNESADPLARARAALGQTLYGGVPNLAPVELFPGSGAVQGAVVRGASDVAERLSPAARLAAQRVSAAIPEGVRRFNAEEGGSATIGTASGVDLVRNALQRTLGRPPTDAEVNQAVEASKAFSTGEAPSAPSAEALPSHLDPNVVGAATAQRNQLVHDTNNAFIDAASRLQNGEAGSAEQMLAHLQSLRDMGVSDKAILRTLTEGMGPGAGPRLMSLLADQAPGEGANAALAASRGVDPAAALRGTIETPSARAEQLKARLSSPPAQPATAAADIRTQLAPQTSTTALADRLKQGIGAASSDADVKTRAALRKEALARIQAEKAGAVPQPVTAKPTPAGLSLLDKNVSAEDLLAQRARQRMEGTPVGNPTGTSAAAERTNPAAVQQVKAARASASGELKPTQRAVKPANTVSRVTSSAPAPAPKGPSLGQIIEGRGRVVQKGSAAAGPATRKLVTPTPTPPTVTPTSPLKEAAAGAVSSSTAKAAASRPLSEGAQRAAASIAESKRRGPVPPEAPMGTPGGTRATGGRSTSGGGRLTKNTLYSGPTLNKNTLQYEVRRGGQVVGAADTPGAALKQAQAWHRLNGGGAGTPPGKPPTTGGTSGGNGLPPEPAKSVGDRLTRVAESIMATPKTLEVSGAPFHGMTRHAQPLAFSDPGAWLKGWQEGAKTLARSDAETMAAHQQMKDIAQQNGLQRLAIQTPGHGGIATGEGDVAGGVVNNLVPGVRKTSAAFTMSLNAGRLEAALNAVKNAEARVNRPLTQEEKDGISTFINHYTGRGIDTTTAGKARSLTLANLLMYSPQLQLARIRQVGDAGYGLYRLARYGINDPQGRVALSLARGSALGYGVSYAAMRAAGLNINDDPTNSNYGKVDLGTPQEANGILALLGSEVGYGTQVYPTKNPTTGQMENHVFIDPSSGESPYIRLAAREGAGSMTTAAGKTYDLANSIQKGEINPATGKKYNLVDILTQKTRWDPIEEFGASRLGPIPSLAYQYLKGQQTDVPGMLLPMPVSAYAEGSGRLEPTPLYPPRGGGANGSASPSPTPKRSATVTLKPQPKYPWERK